MKLFEQLTGEEDIVLDIFAGSASTAHAIYSLNNLTRSNRKFICIQNNELISKNSLAYNLGFTNICDIAIDRIKRVGKRYSLNNSGVNYFKIELL
jgi:adenine-specific DNA-methyltransferase